MKTPNIDIVVWKNAFGVWSAQLMKYDIYAEGVDIQDALDNLDCTIHGEKEYCIKHNVPLSSVGTPPAINLDTYRWKEELSFATADKISDFLFGKPKATLLYVE